VPEQGRSAPRVRIVEVQGDDTADAEAALALIERVFPRADRYAPEDLRSELEEKRRRLMPRSRSHLLVAKVGGEVVGTVYGTYLAGPNCGFVAYLAVRADHRRAGIAPRLRSRLVARFRAEARRTGRPELAWTVGEVRRSSRWLLCLVGGRGALPLDFAYHRPGIDPSRERPPYVLYLEPVGEGVRALPPLLVQRILFAIYRTVYRVRYPLQHAGFRAMIQATEGRGAVGPDPEVMQKAGRAAGG